MNEFRHAVKGPLASVPWGTPDNFLGLPEPHANFDSARTLLLPVPYQATVSWKGGTKDGPRAIIDASHYLELYDHELDSEPYETGIHTLPEVILSGAGPEAAVNQLRGVVDQLLATGKFLIMLSSEHSLSSAPIMAHVDRLGDRRLSVLQFDAHTDLRPEYDDTPFSHASVMYRVHTRVDLVPVGIRSMTADERALTREHAIPVIFGFELQSPDWIDRVMERLGPDVYISFDVDYLDPSVMPSTGTPEPGGGQWYPTLQLLERVFRERRVVGCDVVELAPIPGLVAPDFTVAKLVYKMIGFQAMFGE